MRRFGREGGEDLFRLLPARLDFNSKSANFVIDVRMPKISWSRPPVALLRPPAATFDAEAWEGGQVDQLDQFSRRTNCILTHWMRLRAPV